MPSEATAKRELQRSAPGSAVVRCTHKFEWLRKLRFWSRGTATLLFVPSWQEAGEPTVVLSFYLDTMRSRMGGRQWATREIIFRRQLGEVREPPTHEKMRPPS